MNQRDKIRSSDKHIESLLGKQVKRYRLDQNMSQAKLAETAGLSRRTITAIELGEGSTINTLIRILRALNQLEILSPLLEAPPVSHSNFIRQNTTNHASTLLNRAKK